KGAVVRFGEVEIRTTLRERDEARAEYDEARGEGRQAALVTRESEDVFTMSITGIEPDVEVEVLVDFVAIAGPVESGWELRFPLTVPPRFVREDETGTTRADSNPLALAIDPGHRFSMKLEIADARDIKSSTHEVTVRDENGVAAVTLSRGKVTPDRDLLLSWRPNIEGSLGGILYAERDGDDTYFMLLAGANARGENAVRALNREVSLLVDHSGSMEGAKWQAADWAVKKFLLDLGEGDHFNVAFFHNDVFPLSKKMLRASPGNVGKAEKFVTENRSSGGTELGVALERMLMIPKISPGEKIARQLLVITDAEVTDSGRILALAKKESAGDVRRRISVLCIDAAPNSTLTNRLAERGGGTTAWLTSDPDAEDVTTAVETILSRWSRPVVESVTLELAADSLRVAGRETAKPARGRVRINLGSLMGGEPLWVIGKISGLRPEEPVRVDFDGFGVAVAVVTETRKRDAINTLYGARQIQELELLKAARLTGEDSRNELLALGYEAGSEKNAVCAENENGIVQKIVDGLLLDESLKYGVVSGRTALVASRVEKGQIVEETILTPNALPDGWDGNFMYSPIMGAPRMSCAPQRLIMLCCDSEPNMDEEDSPESTITIYDGAITVPGAGEVTLKEMTGSGRLSGLVLSGESLNALAGDGEKMDGLYVLVYVDGGTSPSARVRLSDLVRLGGKRPLNIAYDKNVRFTLRGDGDAATLEKLSLSVF
ncbi:MAG: VIT and VWA domain-containing protein, partial [Synergistaceae bacterium]|nr:VIT and VWA domain-containing protein [Synergistaceae bacterium]